MPVAEIPGLDISAEHRAVVVFGIGNDCGILLGAEVGICGAAAIESEPCSFFTTQIGKSCDHLVFAAFRNACAGEESVSLGIAAEVVEARVAVCKCSRHCGIGFTQVFEDCLHRLVEAVEVEAIKANFLFSRVDIAVAEPTGEVEHIAVSPHPLGESFESTQRIGCSGVAIEACHKCIHSPRIRPVGFDGHGVETEFVDEPFRDLCTGFIEFMCAMRGLSEHDDFCFFAALDEAVVVRQISAQWLRAASNRFDSGVHATSAG